MNYYLVDYENIRGDGVKDLTGIKEDDIVIIFYSDQCKNISLDIIEGMVERNIKFNCSKVSTGSKNALDFQLSSYLGYLIGKKGEMARYYIVSNDKGFDCLCEYWKRFNMAVERITSKVRESLETDEDKKVKVQAEKKSKVKEGDIATLKDIKKVLTEEDEPEEVLKIFNQYKTKQAICNGMSKHFKDSKRTSTIYKKLKPLLKEKNKS